MIEIRPLDVSDDDQLQRYHEILFRAEMEDGRDWNTVWSLPELVSAFRETDDDEKLVGLCAWEGDEIVGGAFAAYPLESNTDSVWVMPFVEPVRRRQGIGSALMKALVADARREGRTKVEAETTAPFAEREGGPTLSFAAKHGFAVANMEIQRKLPLPVPEDLLDMLQAEAADHHGDYEILTVEGLLPEELHESYCRLSNLLITEAPSGDFEWEEDSLTPAVYREQVRKQIAVGRRRYTTVAVRDGQAVAMTDLLVSKGTERAQQWYTLVDRAHRGHRLGTAVKVANLRRMQAENPDRVDVVTSNAETNANMVDINDRLGFEAVACVPGFLRKL